MPTILPHSRFVVILELPAKGVGKHLARHLTSQVIEFFVHDHFAQADRPLELGSAWQSPFRVDRSPRLFVRQRQTSRSFPAKNQADPSRDGTSSGILTVHLQLLAKSQLAVILDVLIQLAGIGGGGRGRTEEGIENPFPRRIGLVR